MTDYAQITDYSAKDVLITGDPEKLILGSDIDADLDAISVAIISKADTADVASTTVRGLIEIATAAETVTGTDNVRAVSPLAGAGAYARLGTANTFTADQQIEGGAPRLVFDETDARNSVKNS